MVFDHALLAVSEYGDREDLWGIFAGCGRSVWPYHPERPSTGPNGAADKAASDGLSTTDLLTSPLLLLDRLFSK